MFAGWSIIQKCLRQVRIHQVPPTKAWQCVVSWCLLNHVACVLSKSITCTQLAMRFLQLRIFIEVSFLLKQHKYTKRTKKVWFCFSDPFFWGSKIEIKHTKIIKPTTFEASWHRQPWSLPRSHRWWWSAPGLRQSSRDTATNQPRVWANTKKVAMKWKKWHSKPEILASIRFYPSFLQLFCFFPFFFFPTSLLLFLLLYRAPFCWSQLFLLMPFPWNHP